METGTLRKVSDGTATGQRKSTYRNTLLVEVRAASAAAGGARVKASVALDLAPLVTHLQAVKNLRTAGAHVAHLLRCGFERQGHLVGPDEGWHLGGFGGRSFASGPGA